MRARWLLPFVCAFAGSLGCARHARDEVLREPIDVGPPPKPLAPVTTAASHVSEYFGTPRPPLYSKKKAGDCLEKGGCHAPKAIAPCEPQRDAYTLAEAMTDPHRLENRFISIRAPLVLSGGGVTEVGCFPSGACCNWADGELGFGQADHASWPEVHLWNHHEASRFMCRGDESAMCCGTIADGHDIIATGALRSYLLQGGQWSAPSVAWFLDDVEICRPQS
jgi:hypothetical protein